MANVAAGPAAAPPNPFGGGNIVGAMPAMFESVAPVPLFGILTTVTPPGATLLWETVVSGGRWAPETRSALHADANPSNPAGPDVHASGIHVSGLLAYDVARHAMRRAQPILPFPGGTLG